MPLSLENWKQWEGSYAGSVYPLVRCLGAGERGAVFETEFERQPAAIKLIPGSPASIAELRSLWSQCATLSHPALIRIFSSGETVLDGHPHAYVVMERAEENLADVLTERHLTPDEARQMLAPLLDALRYLHGKGYAHGRLKPANILATGDQLGISSDGLVPSGDTDADYRALGSLLDTVLGDAAGGNASSRWSRASIEAFAQGGLVPAPESASKRLWWGVGAAGVAAAGLGLTAFWPARTVDATPPPVTAPVPPPASVVEDKPLPTSGGARPAARSTKKPPPTPEPSRAANKKSSPEPPRALTQQPALAPPTPRVAGNPTAAISRVMPDIPRDALATISGRVRVNVRVRVDPSGNVREAALQPPSASRYFTSRVLAAARAWKFAAGDSAHDRTLRFDLTREGIQASAE